MLKLTEADLEKIAEAKVTVSRRKLVLLRDLTQRTLQKGERSKELPNGQSALLDDYYVLIEMYHEDPSLFVKLSD